MKNKNSSTKPLSDRVEVVAQIGSLLFGAVLTGLQIFRTIKGEAASDLTGVQ